MADLTVRHRGRAPRPVADRLWEKVDRPAKGCWEYPGHPSRSGHMLIWCDGRMRAVHRVSWELTNGPIPPCVRPDHLFLGTQGDNTRDRDAKGQHVALKGEQNGLAKLTDDDVRAIRAAYVPYKVGMYRLAKQYGVNQGAIWQIIHRRTWTHVE